MIEQKPPDQSDCESQKNIEHLAENREAKAGRLFDSITQILIRLLEFRPPPDAGHSSNVAEIARQVASELKLSEDSIGKVYLAALLHDVGMIPIEDLLLQKRGSLTPEEFRRIQEHSALAEYVLKPILDDGEVLRYIRHHHERYDGSGYPDGLKGNIIPLGARIVAVAEAFDAMTRPRAYRKALTPQVALAELQRCADSQFDPQIVSIFAGIFEQIMHGLRTSVLSRP
jgi:putative two-component system response regulator